MAGLLFGVEANRAGLVGQAELGLNPVRHPPPLFARQLLAIRIADLDMKKGCSQRVASAITWTERNASRISPAANP